MTALSLQGKEVSMPCVKFNTDKTIVDSGTSNLHLPSEVGLSPHCVAAPHLTSICWWDSFGVVEGGQFHCHVGRW